MTGNKNKATWFLFTTVLSIFNICTIRIFDGYNWPFYAVTVNAVLSLGGLIFHLHANEAVRKHLIMRAARFLLLLNSISVFLPDSVCDHSAGNRADACLRWSVMGRC